MFNDALRDGKKPNIKTFRCILQEVIPPDMKIPMSPGYFDRFKNRNINILEFLKKKNSPESSFISLYGTMSSCSSKFYFKFDQLVFR